MRVLELACHPLYRLLFQPLDTGGKKQTESVFDPNTASIAFNRSPMSLLVVEVEYAQAFNPRPTYARYVKAAIAVCTVIGSVAWLVTNKRMIEGFFNKSLLSNECEVISNVNRANLTNALTHGREGKERLKYVNTSNTEGRSSDLTGLVTCTLGGCSKPLSSSNTTVSENTSRDLRSPFGFQNLLQNLSSVNTSHSNLEATDPRVSSMHLSLSQTNQEGPNAYPEGTNLGSNFSVLAGIVDPSLNLSGGNLSTQAVNSTPETEIPAYPMGTSLNETNHEDTHAHVEAESVTANRTLPNEKVTPIGTNSTSSQPADLPPSPNNTEPEPQPSPIVSVQQIEPHQQGEIDYPVVASMIGLSEKILREWPDLARFIVANNIHLNLKNFGDKVTVGRYGIPTLTIHGKAGSWNLLRDRIPIDKETGKLVGKVYTRNGFEPITS